MATGDDLRAARRAAHLSTRELARRVHYSHSQVLNWERGASQIPPAVVAQLVAVLKDELAERAEVAHMLSEIATARDDGGRQTVR